MPFRDVDITLQNDTPVANPDRIQLSHGQGHTLNWHNKLSESLTITFGDGGPFHTHEFEVPAGRHVNSGRIKVDPGDKVWKYTIRTASGKVKDPDVIIGR